MDHVVFDVEIIHPIESLPNGWDDTDRMGVSVAALWQYADRRLRIYGPDEVGELKSRLLKADRISGYNILNFDYPCLWAISRPDWRKPFNEVATLKSTLKLKTDDLLRRIWQAQGLDPDNFGKSHGGHKLQDIATATLGKGKILNGEEAPRLYQQGKVQAVANYCADDVCLERDLCDFIEGYGYVLKADGSKVKIPPWQPGR